MIKSLMLDRRWKMMMEMVNRSSTVRVTALRITEKSHSKSKMFQKAALSHPE